MAVIKLGVNQESVEDGGLIKEACEKLGVPFGCTVGVCGTCKIEIVSGAENLSQLTKYEVEMGDRDKNNRLACQCQIIKDEVTIKEE